MQWTWKELESMGNLPVIKQSYLFILLVPFFSRIVNTYNDAKDKVPVETIDPVANILIDFSNVAVNISLPFNPFILYMSSLAFLLARIGLKIWIPSIIIDIPDYKTYIDLSLQTNDLDSYIDALEKEDPKYKIQATREKKLYHEIFDYFNKTSTLNIKMSISFLFLLGWGGMAYLVYEGMMVVIDSAY